MASAQRKRTRSVFVPDPRQDATRYVMPFIYEREHWSKGKSYFVRVSNVYDPSKFWIVGMNKGLCAFQTSILNFYLQNGKKYKMHRCFVKEHTYCVTCVNDAYFRGIIVNKPMGIERRVAVFLIDFGFKKHVKLSSLYHFHESYYEVPRFSMRARLSTIKPYEGYTWTSNIARKFDALVVDKIFTITIDHIDPIEKVIYISHRLDTSDIRSFAGIAKALLDKKLAREEDVDVRNIPVCHIPHFLPTFDIIEYGIVLNVVKIIEKVNCNPSTSAPVKVYSKKEKK